MNITGVVLSLITINLLLNAFLDPITLVVQEPPNPLAACLVLHEPK